jgi:hypothetical protein
MSGREEKSNSPPPVATTGGVVVGQEVLFSYKEDGEKQTVKAKIEQVGECVSVLVEATGRKLREKVAEMEKSDFWAPRLEEIKVEKQKDPLKPISTGPLPFRKYANEVMRKFQLVLVNVEPGVSFWYLLQDCNPANLQKIGVYCFAYRKPAEKKGGKWDPEDLAFHAKCTEMEAAHPGILTTISNWISYGMASTGIRRFDLVEALLTMPYVNRPELIPYFKAQYAKDLQNLVSIAAPLGIEMSVYRGSEGFKDLHTNFTSPTFLSTTPNAKTSAGFADFNYSKVKQFQIPADYPVVDLRDFNKEEQEILLIPPLTFHLVKRGLNTPSSEANLNVFRLNLANRTSSKGGKQTRRRSKK